MRAYLPILATLVYLAFAGWLAWQAWGLLSHIKEELTISEIQQMETDNV